MDRSSTAFSIGVGVLAAIVAIVAASVFASSQARRASDSASAEVNQLREEAMTELAKKADMDEGHFERIQAEEVSATAVTVSKAARAGDLTVDGPTVINGDLEVVAMTDDSDSGTTVSETVLQVAPAGVWLAQLTSGGNIQNEDGTFVVDRFGVLNAASANFLGSVQAAAAEFVGGEGFHAEFGAYSLDFGPLGFSIVGPGGEDYRMGFSPSGGANDKLPTDKPYLFAEILAANQLIPLREGAVAFPRAYSDDVLSAGWIGKTGADAETMGDSVSESKNWVLTAGKAVTVDGSKKNAVVVNGALYVNGAAAFTKSLEVDEASTFNDGLTITGGGLDVTGGFDVSGDTSMTGDASIGGRLDVSGDTSMTGDASIGGRLDVSGDTSMTGDASILGDASIGGALRVATIHNGGAVIQVEDPVEVDGDLTVTGPATFQDGIQVTSSSNATSTIGPRLAVNGDLYVSGSVFASGTVDTGGSNSKTLTLTQYLELRNAELRLFNSDVVVTQGDFRVDVDDDGTPDFVIDSGTLLASLPSALEIDGIISVASVDFGVDVDGDWVPDFRIDRATKETSLPGNLTLGAGGDADIPGYAAVSGAIDNGAGSWAGTATILGGNTNALVNPGTSFDAIVVTPVLGPGENPLADYGVQQWWVVDNGNDTFDIVTDAPVAADMTFSYVVIR